MRNVAFFLAFFWGLSAYAQRPSQFVFAKGEKYYSLDTNNYLSKTPLAKIKDTLNILQKAAEKVSDHEFVLCLKLFTYQKEFKEHLKLIE